VRLEEPAWWYGPGGQLIARVLGPFAALWGGVATRSYERTAAYACALPVICIGNFTAGGTGKTPLSLLVVSELRQLGKQPAFLTRGYGGRLAGPHWVDAERDTAAQVGDEPLLLARRAPTLVSRDRAAGARAIETSGRAIDVIVMDDGLQNPALVKDLTLALVDGRRGLGNGRVIPAGPLRAPLDFQLDLADAIVVNTSLAGATPSNGDVAEWLRSQFPGPVLSGSVDASAPVPWLEKASVVAFAGIGVPQRFFDLLIRLGAKIEHALPFPDHHPFTDADAERLLAMADRSSALLVTTEKDWARLGTDSANLARLKQLSRPLPVAMTFDDRNRDRLLALIEAALVSRTAPRG